MFAEILLSSTIINTKNNRCDLYVLNNKSGQELIFRFINLDSIPFFIPHDSWLSNVGDTLIIDAIYKRYNKSDDIFCYNEFNPPIMDEIRPDSEITKKINYKNLKIIIPKYVSVRVYNNIIPYDPVKDFTNYHSEKSFLEYEKYNSFLVVSKIDDPDKINAW